MDEVGKMLADAVSALLPVIVSTLAPVVTAAVKALVGESLPASIKPLVNAVAGAVLAGVMGGDPTQGVVGAMVANRVREAYQK